MSNKNLYLVGTVHIDIDGRKRLDTLLNKLSPSTIALGFHEEKESANGQQSEELVGKSSQERDTRFEKSGLHLSENQRRTVIEMENRIKNILRYELEVSRNYKQQNPGTILEYIDIPVFENGKEEVMQGLWESMDHALELIADTPSLREPFLEALDGGTKAIEAYHRKNIQDIYDQSKEVGQFFEIMKDPKLLTLMKESMSDEQFTFFERVYNSGRDEAIGSRIRELYDGRNRLVGIVGLGHLHGINKAIEELEPTVMALANYDSI